jgi:hypothetical protein
MPGTGFSTGCYGVDPNDELGLQQLYDTNPAFKQNVDDCYQDKKVSHGGCDPDLPTSGDEPPYEPGEWNSDDDILFGSNCYAYACNDKRETPHPGKPDKPQPGDHAQIGPCRTVTCKSIFDRVRADARVQGKNVAKHSCDSACPSGTYKAMLVLGQFRLPDGRSGIDYHWYRQNNDDSGSWSHKPGCTEVTDRDSDGRTIGDPRKANRGGYKHVCGCMCIPASGITVGR